MLRPAKLATPAAAVTVVVPFSVPPPGLLPIVSVTPPVNPVARLPKESYAVTSTAGVMVAPAVVLVGCTVNTSWDAAAGEIVKRSEEHTSELQSRLHLVCRLLLEKKK